VGVVRRLSERAFTPVFARYERAFTLVFARCALILTATAMLAAAPAAHAETGLASWYSGGGTACGDRTVQPFTAAHRTLPCGAVVRVTTIAREDGRKRPNAAGSVTVTIRDRGPFIRGRIIDLDRQAGVALGLIGPGVLPVTVERVR
jgi:rare lipoprotein A